MYSPAIPFLWYFDELKCYMLQILIKNKITHKLEKPAPPKKQRDNAEISVTIMCNLSNNITDEHFAVKNRLCFIILHILCVISRMSFHSACSVLFGFHFLIQLQSKMARTGS